MAANLTREEDAQLVRMAQAGDLSARNTLMERHIGLIWQVTAFAVGQDDADEYLSHAIEAMVDVIGYFDPDRGWRLMTFATPAIKRRCWRAKQTGGLVRIPPRTETESERTKAQKDLSVNILSFDAPTGVDEGSNMHNLRGSDDPKPMEDGEEVRKLARALNCLPARLAEVARLRSEGRTLEEIGERLQVTKERVRQLEAKAYAQLRTLMLTDALPEPVAA